MPKPHERLMAAALYVEMVEGISPFTVLPDARRQPFESLMHCDGIGGVEWVGALYPQARFGQYIVDFFLEVFDQESGKPWFTAVIECDGHEYHERTKEQARHDKQRDRWFQTQGIHVYRFTGREIWENPLGCAEQVYEAFWAASRRRRDGRE